MVILFSQNLLNSDNITLSILRKFTIASFDTLIYR